MSDWEAMGPKAIENLEAASRLLSGGVLLPNAAASRAYYAVYQACWLCLARQSVPVSEYEDGSRCFRHSEVPRLARRAQVLTRDESETFEFLQTLRVTADYYREGVESEESVAALAVARTLMISLLGKDADGYP